MEMRQKTIYLALTEARSSKTKATTKSNFVRGVSGSWANELRRSPKVGFETVVSPSSESTSEFLRRGAVSGKTRVLN